MGTKKLNSKFEVVVGINYNNKTDETGKKQNFNKEFASPEHSFLPQDPQSPRENMEGLQNI